MEVAIGVTEAGCHSSLDPHSHAQALRQEGPVDGGLRNQVTPRGTSLRRGEATCYDGYLRIYGPVPDCLPYEKREDRPQETSFQQI
ncbi:hypothetical protein NDU88_001435 [Pleurodeles waltl]|uniref:Uncharacterized protein n=1 Tax=Pleurodeles waltl TaxID=8319 RepID=A0AAV7U6W0_PLEWA|nr:hypothetical protein NDU88_001435 [Pleurodeles waltl]